MASIIIASGERKGDYYPLGRRTNVIGRGEQLLIQILDDQVSRKHVQIRYDEGTGQHWVLDMSSRNGVFLNGTKLSCEVSLADGDRILIGDTEMLYATEDFTDRESALNHYKKVGERNRPTFVFDPRDRRSGPR